MRSVAILLLSLGSLTGPVRAQPGAPLIPSPDVSFSITIPINNPDGVVHITPRQWAEMGAVALTGAGHIAFTASDASAYFIPLAIGGWGGYVGYRAATESDFLRNAGFTSENLGPAFRDASILAGAATAGMLVIGAANGNLRFDVDMLPLLVLYPAWGITQQFLVQGLITRRLAEAGLSPVAVTPISAAAFGSVHVSDWKLTAATAGLGAAYAALYQKHGNLWPLGLYHGVLGAEFYVWVLGRNPWQELLGNEEPLE